MTFQQEGNTATNWAFDKKGKLRKDKEIWGWLND